MTRKPPTPSEAAELLFTAGLRPPKTLTVAVTGVCNLTCAHCWVDAGLAGSSGPVPAATLCRLLEEFAASGAEGVCFTGGEPLCHPDWRQILRFARTAGFARVGVQTNGMLCGDEAVAVLRDLDFSGMSLQISLDGATATAHDRVRGEGAFRGAIAGLRRLVQGGLGPRITIFFTEMRHNLEEIPAVLRLAEDLGVGSVVTGALVRCGRAAADSPVGPADPDQYASLLQRFDADPLFRERYRAIGNIAPIEWRRESGIPSECCTFVENPYLTARGLLYPCVMCHADPFAIADVFEKGFAAAVAEGIPLWSSLQRISRRRAAALEQCRDCPGRVACGGGCMGRAWGSCGDLLAPDDRCGVRQSVYRLRGATK